MLPLPAKPVVPCTVNVQLPTEGKEADVIYPAPLVIALLFKDMFAEPLNETPAIVLAVCNTVALPALPDTVV